MKSKQRNARVRFPFSKIFLSLSKIIETRRPPRKPPGKLAHEHVSTQVTFAGEHVKHVV